MQAFNQEKCLCECNVSNEIRYQCHTAQNGQRKIWNEATCDCRCEKKDEFCSTGFRYDYKDKCE